MILVKILNGFDHAHNKKKHLNGFPKVIYAPYLTKNLDLVYASAKIFISSLAFVNENDVGLPFLQSD